MTPLELYKNAIAKNSLVLLAGCGGFHAHAQHMAAELVVRYKRTRNPIRAITLGCNPAITSAAVNDFGASHMLSREALALASPGDLLVIYSTSGQSPMLRWLAHDLKNICTILAWCPPQSLVAGYAHCLGTVWDQESVLHADHQICEQLGI
jgi:hypothetical protein